MASELPMLKTIGPTLPSIYLDGRVECDTDYGLSLFKQSEEANYIKKWLETKEKDSVVFVSFGSVDRVKEEQMEELSEGLKNSNGYFLWVVRAAEECKLPTKFKEETKEKGLIVNWCSQVEVLAHRGVGCFVTHCGWNSTLEALSSGVPMVAVPQWTDQITNAKWVVDVWNAGIKMKVNDKGIISREEIEHCINQVLDQGERGNELRRNAVKWKELAKEATCECGTSHNNIGEFVSQLLSM